MIKTAEKRQFPQDEKSNKKNMLKNAISAPPALRPKWVKKKRSKRNTISSTMEPWCLRLAIVEPFS